MNLVQSRKDCKVLDQLLDNYEEDCGGGDDEQQPLLLSLHVLLGGDRFRADGDDQADGENNLQCVPVAGDCLSKFQVVNHCENERKLIMEITGTPEQASTD